MLVSAFVTRVRECLHKQLAPAGVLVVATGASKASTGVAGCALASVVVSTASAAATRRVTRYMSQASTDQLSGPTRSQVKRKRGDNGGDIDDIDTSATGDSQTDRYLFHCCLARRALALRVSGSRPAPLAFFLRFGGFFSDASASLTRAAPYKIRLY